jgi:uncharacterized repeat protein (TIGR02543 family)
MTYPGNAFTVTNYTPPNANGTYFPGTGKITFGPINHYDDGQISYRFSLEVTSGSLYGKDIHMSGDVTHDVVVPWRDVAFDAGEGRITGVWDSLRVIATHPLGALPDAARTGYTLTQWADEDGKAVTEGAIITTDTSIHAVWEANTYTMFYDLNGGGAVSPGSFIVTYDKAIGPLSVPERTGYTFAGWKKRPDGGPEVTESAIWQTPGDGTLYASWTANRYIVYLDAAGGTPGFTHKLVTYDDIYGAFIEPSYEGRVFLGWYTEPDGLGQCIEPTQDVDVARDQRFYAHYTEEADRTVVGPVGVNEWTAFEGHTYRFDKQGTVLTGLRKVGNNYHYFDSEGKLLVRGTVRLAGYTLKADANGRITNMPSPNRTTVTYAKATKKKSKKVKVKWKKLIGVSGYEVQYALDKAFKKEVGIKDAKDSGKKQYTISRLAARRYYVRVRGYFVIDGLKVPGKYSKAIRSRL